MDPTRPERPDLVQQDDEREYEAIFSAAARRLVDALSVSSDDVDAAYASAQAQIALLPGDLCSTSPTHRDKAGEMRPVVETSVRDTWHRASRFVHRGVWYTAAAMTVGVAGVMLLWNAAPRRGTRSRGAVTTYATTNGQRATITLPDGNTVALNVASRLEVPMDYLSGNHTVVLHGEGLFTVSHRSEIPFIVSSGNTETRVLGTSFVVRHYVTDTTSLVVVREGKVAVSAMRGRRPSASVVLTASRQVDVSADGRSHEREADPAAFGFVTGVLTFNGKPLGEAIADLNRWYDADIRLGAASLATRRVTGGFAAGSRGDLAEVLALTFDLHVVRDGRVLTLYPR